MVIISQRNEGFFVTMSCVVTRGYKKNGTNFGKKVGIDTCKLFEEGNRGNIAILDVAMGTSMPDVKMETPLED